MKWEYCAVVYVSTEEHYHLSGGHAGAEVGRLTAEGYKYVEIRKEDPNALAQAIARLGEDGWEIVGCGNVGERHHAVYFKRPKP